MSLQEQLATLTISDKLLILVTLLSPILAVQVQKWLEVIREERRQRLWIFKTLMATRANILAMDHVQALNMIDLEYSERKYKPVTTAWKTYLDHLATFPTGIPAQLPNWIDKRNDYLTNLLIVMGKSVGYDFDEVHVKKGIYAPEAHSRIEQENELIRQRLLRLLGGEGQLKMEVVSFPVTDEEAAEQKALRDALLAALKGGFLRVAFPPPQPRPAPQPPPVGPQAEGNTR